MSEMPLKYEVLGPVAVLSLNRPEKLNAVHPAMVAALHSALDRAEADEAVRVILLRGEGRAFSAGFDMDVDVPEGADAEAFWREELQKDFNIIMRFWESSRVTVSAVQGYCLGSAMEMALACDLTLAAEDCRFGVPEVAFGSGVVAMLLPWLAPAKVAKELLLTADKQVGARRMESLGLVNRVVPGPELDEAAMDLARQVAANDLQAVRLTKQAINQTYRIMGMPEALAQALDCDVQIETLTSNNLKDTQ